MENNKKNRPKIYNDTLRLVLLLEDIYDLYPKKYKYGWGAEMQKISRELFQCVYASQTLTDFNQRAKQLEWYLVKFDTLYTLLEIINYKSALPSNKINLIYRTMREIAPQIKGLRTYFATRASESLAASNHSNNERK